MCAIRSVMNESEFAAPTRRPTNTNRSMRDTPVTISGFIMGMFVTMSSVFFHHFLRR